mmetsp:Transcript_84334/g.243808  ORF Transcript_84334/g.243808 Transcript_84334/m.243808 type:complete len:221 (-) Transcript_84334:68-730(-)
MARDLGERLRRRGGGGRSDVRSHLHLQGLRRRGVVDQLLQQSLVLGLDRGELVVDGLPEERSREVVHLLAHFREHRGRRRHLGVCGHLELSLTDLRGVGLLVETMPQLLQPVLQPQQGGDLLAALPPRRRVPRGGGLEAQRVGRPQVDEVLGVGNERRVQVRDLGVLRGDGGGNGAHRQHRVRHRGVALVRAAHPVDPGGQGLSAVGAGRAGSGQDEQLG